MIFAWRPDALCVPSRRGEAWHPEGCTFRPSLAAFSPERWVPAAIEDPLGMHLMLEGASTVWVHHFLSGFPPRAARSSRDEVSSDLRDGDVSGAKPSSAFLVLGVAVWAICGNFSGRLSARLFLACFLGVLCASGVPHSRPVAYNSPARGIMEILLDI